MRATDPGGGKSTRQCLRDWRGEARSPEWDRKCCKERPNLMDFVPPIYSVVSVFPKPGMVAMRVKRDLNAFPSLWLRNLKKQGHRLAAGVSV